MTNHSRLPLSQNPPFLSKMGVMTQTETDTTTSPAAGRSTTIALAVIILAAVAVRLYLMATTRSTAEDFYITLRYAENLAHGRGLVYNSGEDVLGTTTPLYTLFLAFVSWLGLDATLWGKLANIAADAIGCYLVYRLGRCAGRPWAGLIAAALFALSPPNLTWAISGMETSLVTACTLALFVAAAERKLLFVALTGALLYLLRVDGLLAVLVAYGGLAWSAKREGDARAVARSFGLFLLLCLPWTLFAWSYYGSPLPTSALAKLTVYAWMSKGAFPNLGPFVYQMTHTRLHQVVLAGTFAGVVVGFARLHKLRPAIVWIVVYYAAMALSKGFLFGWYFVPPSGVYFLLAVIGWEAAIILASRPYVERRSRVPWLAPSISFVVLALGLVRIPGVRVQIRADQETEERLRKPIGLALKEIVKPGERVMLEPIGYIGYFSGARILDAVGLVSPEVIPYYRQGAVSPYLDLMHDLKPEWVLLRAGEYADSLNAAVPPDRALLAHYRMFRTFSDPSAPPGATPAFFLLKRL